MNLFFKSISGVPRVGTSLYSVSKQQKVNLIGTLAFLMAAASSWTQSAYGEGSVNLTSSGGNRPYLEYSTNASAFIAGVPRRTTIKVYVQSGETIDLGSSAVGIGSGTINYRSPNGTAGSCGGAGFIANRAQEVAGPNPNPGSGGFVPCTVTGAQSTAAGSGIWEIDFVSPSPGSLPTNPTPSAANANWSAQTAANTFVAAWDVTVRDAGGAVVTGRAYANYLALNMGGNSRSFSSALVVLTRDGYQYRVDGNGLDPFGFTFFADEQGFTDTSGNPLFQSIQLTGANPGTLPPGITFRNPNQPDTPIDRTHKLFFNIPNNAMPQTATSRSGTTWLNPTTAPPPTASNFAFTGNEGTPNAAGTSPLGGQFSFNASAPGSYQIRLDLNNNGIYGDADDRILVGSAGAGPNSVPWDGRDANGIPVPAGATAYDAQISLFAGETHFPILDPENNPNGLIIQRITPAGLNPNVVYYNDRYNYNGSNTYDYSLCAAAPPPPEPPPPPPPDAGAAGCYGTPPTPRSGLAGVDSSGGAHKWSSNFGDRRGMDTWAYFPSSATSLQNRILIRQADLAITKTRTPTTVISGSAITYTITVTNNGPSNVTGASVIDDLPDTIANPTWSCAITSGIGSCVAASGSGDINTTVNLNNGAIATYTVTGTISPTASGTLSNTATVLRPNDVTDPNDPTRQGANNNRATDTTTIGAAAAVAGTKSVALAADVDGTGSLTPGDRVRYTITYTNTGSAAATNFQIVDPLPAGLTIFGTLTVTPTGVGTNAAVNPAYNGAGTNTLLDIGAVLATNGTITVTVEATVGSGATGNLFNQATATSDAPGFPPGGVLTDATTPPGNIDQTPYPNNGATDPTGITVGAVPVPLANKSVRFVTDNDGTQTLTIGDDLQYTITVRNTTSSPINNLVISDVIPVQLRVLRNTINVSGGFTVASSLPNDDFDGTGNSVALTNPGTLPAGATATLTFNARLKPGSASPITNQGRVNYAGDGGNPVLTDASDSNNPTAPGTNNDPGDPGVGTGNNVSQPNSSPSDPTIINFVSPFEPNGTKSVRIFTDTDNNGVLTKNDVVEYTVTYTNSNPTTVITDFLATDSLPNSLSIVPNSYSFTFSGTGTTVTGNPNYNGTTDTNLTKAEPRGALGSGGGQVVIKFRATVTAAANTTIANQASATSVGGLSPSITDAVAGPSDLPQGLDDGTNQGNQGNTGDDDPTLLTVVATPVVSGTKAVAIATDADGTGSVTTGDRVRYTITYTNTGAGAANSFQINDVLPTGLTLAATPTVTPSGSGTVAAVNPSYNGTNAPTLLATGAILAPNGTITVTVDAIVNSGVTGNLFNQAIASSPAPGFPAAGVPTDAITPPGSINQSPYGDTGPADKTGLTITASGVPRLRLVKRITNAMRNGVPISEINFGSFINDPNDSNDDAPGFSQLSPIGVSKLGQETPLTSGDEVDYTIYFLSDGTGSVNNVRFCDLIPSGTTFVPDSFGVGAGISLNRAGTTGSVTNAADTDAGTFFSPLAPLPSGNACPSQNNPDGAVILNLGNVSNTSGNNFGFIRFRVKIN
ncbi:DUF11 domain-containing protein [Trichocoleus sp. FACHB-90]|uniref:beta strand repeat-containing protein n=1 Tax=Cyanophyceae TaxID=3028117 RepID=UPI001688F663|nr:isopeptide-forming domain-containing fimbrial protein [Trichocoleus sp. FACHB-90]MBD1926137.1 DUF11 domain-containing protein [Trichocoleus sp. FACHB-90]